MQYITNHTKKIDGPEDSYFGFPFKSEYKVVGANYHHHNTSRKSPPSNGGTPELKLLGQGIKQR